MTDGQTDRRTDRRTDGGDCNIPIAFLKKRGDNNVQFHTLNWRPELPMRNYMYKEKH